MMRDNNGTKYVYDAENRISSVPGFTYGYDADGNRVQKTNGNTNPATGTVYWYMSSGIVTGATYNAAGSLTGSIYGKSSSFSGIVNSFSFNSRLQPVNLWSSSPTRTLMNLVYDFHAGNGDNGNVYGITNNRDANRSQTFTY